MTVRSEAIERMLIAIGEEFDHEIERRERRGGQQVTPTGDFVSAGPGVISAMRRWSRDFRRVLAVRDAPPPPLREWAQKFAQEVVESTKRHGYEGARLSVIGSDEVDAILARVGQPPGVYGT